MNQDKNGGAGSGAPVPASVRTASVSSVGVSAPRSRGSRKRDLSHINRHADNSDSFLAKYDITALIA